MTKCVPPLQRTGLMLLAFLLITPMAWATIRRVNSTAPGATQTGNDWLTTAYISLQPAINASASGDTVWVKEGSYTPVSGQSFIMKEGVKILGGFAGSETTFAQRNLALGHNSILQGNGSSVINNDGNGLSNNAVIDGFVITGGSGLFGAGMDLHFSSPIIRNCVFTANVSDYGSAIDLYNSNDCKVINCIFYDNGLYSIGTIHNYGQAHIYNSIFYGNSAINQTIYNESGWTDVVNTIIWGNVANGNPSGINNNGGNVSYNLGPVGTGTGNMDTDPIFVNSANPIGPDGKWFTADDGLQLTALSPAVDAGTAQTGAEKDVRGIPRPSGSAYDIGAYEGFTCQPGSRLYVDASASASGNGSSWATANKELGNALRAAGKCSNITEIWVKGGTYKPSGMPYGAGLSGSRNFSFYLRDSVAIYGGFAGMESSISQRDAGANPTILSGDIGAAGDSSDNCYHVIASIGNNNTAKLDGFIITGGNANTEASVTINGSNVGQGTGGGMTMHTASPMVTNCVFTGNRANNGAAVYMYENSSAAITNCLLLANTTAGSGGGIYSGYASSPSITNCTVIGNTAASGAAVFSYLTAAPIVRNCILWGNTDEVASLLSTPSITYSIVQGGYPGMGNLNADPLFVMAGDPDGTDNKWMTSDDGLRLLFGSPAVNTAGATGAPATDIKGTARPLDGGYDMGAYEGAACMAGTRLYVDAGNTGGNGSGGSWANALTNLSTAIGYGNACTNITEIWVKGGTYKPSALPANSLSSISNRDYAFLLKDNLAIYGAFAGTEALLQDRNIHANPTVLSGNIDTVGNNDCYHVVISVGNNNTAVLDGFTISSGLANHFNASGLNVQGTGITRQAGGGISIYNSAATIRNCTIQDNSALNAGGGLFQIQGNLAISNCTFTNNSAKYGAALRNEGTNSLTLRNCIFTGNHSTQSGSALSLYQGTDTVSNCLFMGNKDLSTAQGGTICTAAGSFTFTGNTFYADSTLGKGGAIRMEGTGGSCRVYNNIFYKNYAAIADNDIHNADGLAGYTQAYNSFSITNPLFANETLPAGADGIWGTTDDGLKLSPCSPAISAGSNSWVSASVTDLAGAPRIFNGTVDAGAYEYQAYPDGSSLAMDGDTTTTEVISGAVSGLLVTGCRIIAQLLPSGAAPVNGLIHSKAYIEGTPVFYSGQNYVQRHYDLIPENNAANATGRVTLFFSQAEFNAYNTTVGPGLHLPANAADATGKANLIIMQYHGTSVTGQPGTYSGAAVNIDPADNAIVWNAALNRWEVTFQVTGFSGFFVTAGNTALSLQLLSFTAKPENGRVRLDWATAKETDTRYFEMEKSGDGRSWSFLGKVMANGKGNNQYFDYDTQPAKGHNYYRLRMVDEEEKSTYSNIALADFGGTGEAAISLYPNPSSNSFVISTSGIDHPVQVSITDMVGRRVFNQPLNAPTMVVDIATLRPGIYNVQINGDRIHYSQKLAIQR